MEDTAPRICNHYLKSAKSFSNEGRIAEHVLERLTLLGAESERPPRPLTPEHFHALRHTYITLRRGRRGPM